MAKNHKERELEEICENVLRKITPSRKEREETLQFSNDLSKKLAEKLRRLGIRAVVRVQGSIAKDTWLAGEKDIDLFILLPKASTREDFPKILNVIKSFLGEKWVEAYAEHPYIEAEIEGYQIDFVPGFRIERAEEALSSVDRTPLHTFYIKKHLTHQVQKEIRLFKQFVRGIGIYGAEIKVKGLSGYLCELLVLYYRSFIKTLLGIASWRIGEVIDIEKFYDGAVDQAQLIFNSPLVFVDPVDAKRNVAAAVSKDRFGELIMAAKLFLDKPNSSFFFPHETIPLQVKSLDEWFLRLKADLIFIIFRFRKTARDVLWGQFYKTTQALRGLLVQNDFQVLRDAVWSDEKEVATLVFLLEARMISTVKRHLGPPIDSKEASRFVDKYTETDGEVIGPWVEADRWIVGVRRRYVDAAILLKVHLRNKAKNVGIASGLRKCLREPGIYVNREILDFYSSNKEFARFLTDFVRGRPKWLI